MNILIVEDDILIAEHLKEIIEEEGADRVQIACSVFEAKELVRNDEIDLMLLDINMEEAESGIQLAQLINEQYQIPFLFVTAQSDKQIVGRAVSMNPVAFIVKPFSPVSVMASVNIARNLIGNDEIIVRDGYKEMLIRKSSILYGKASNNYIELFGLKKKLVIRYTMQNFLMLLPKESFIQVHRSYFVNRNFVESVSTNSLVVRGENIPYSKAYENDVKNLWSKTVN